MLPGGVQRWRRPHCVVSGKGLWLNGFGKFPADMTTGIAPGLVAPAGPAAPPGLARQLGRAGNALLVIFALTVLLALLPPRLLNGAWQLQFTSTLVTNGSMALLGMLLKGLATWLDPEDRDLQAGFNRVKRLSKLVVMGYLLIVPLQFFGFWRVVETAKQATGEQIRSAEIRLERIRKAVEASGSTAELQARLRQLPGAPPLTQEQLSLPMAEIRARFNQAADQSQTRINASPTGPNANQIQLGFRESLRVVVSALALAVAFRTSARVKTRAPLQIDPEQQALFEGVDEPQAKPVNEPGVDEQQIIP